MDLTEKEAKLKLRLAQIEKNEKCQQDFLIFVKNMWPDFIAGRHHKIIAEKLERVARGELKRLIINMAPRHTKSEFASFLFPAWMMGKNPKMKIIQATHTTELAVNFGRKTKNLIDSDDYKETVKHPVVGTRPLVVCTMLLVWVRTWPVVVGT